MTQPDLRPFLHHEDALVRDSVAFQFFESWSADEELVPLTLGACARFGEEACLNLLSFACRFRLSARGLMDALQALAESHPPFVEQWISLAPIELVQARADLVRSLVSFRTSNRLLRRASLRGIGEAELWRRLQVLCRKLDQRTAGARDWDEREDLLEALAPVAGRETLRERTASLPSLESRNLQAALVELTAAEDFTGRSALLLDLLDSIDDGLVRAAARVLTRVSGPSTVREIGERYRRSSRRFRRSALRVLSSLTLESSESALHELLEIEDDPALRGRIFDGLRFRFSAESATLLRRELDNRTSLMIPKEIEKALYVSDSIRGVESVSWRNYRAELHARGEAEIYFHIPFFETA